MTNDDFPKLTIFTWDEFLRSIFPEYRSFCNYPLTRNSWMVKHISVAIFIAVGNDTVQFAKNFLKVGRHDPFIWQKSSIKIYRGALKPASYALPLITLAILYPASTSTNQHLLETFFTVICWFKLIMQPLKTLSKTPFAKAASLTRTLDLQN